VLTSTTLRVGWVQGTSISIYGMGCDKVQHQLFWDQY
jgi:hypothetical protein